MRHLKTKIGILFIVVCMFLLPILVSAGLSKSYVSCRNITITSPVTDYNRTDSVNVSINLPNFVTHGKDFTIVNDSCNKGVNSFIGTELPFKVSNSSGSQINITFNVYKYAGTNQVYSIYYNTTDSTDLNNNSVLFPWGTQLNNGFELGSNNNWTTSGIGYSFDNTCTNIGKVGNYCGSSWSRGSDADIGGIYSSPFILNTNVTIERGYVVNAIGQTVCIDVNCDGSCDVTGTPANSLSLDTSAYVGKKACFNGTDNSASYWSGFDEVRIWDGASQITTNPLYLSNLGVEQNATVYPFVLNGVTYNPTTTSGSVENFTINFTVGSNETLNSIYFYYNTTKYTATLTNNGLNYLGFYSVNVPSVSGATPMSFTWSLNMVSGQYNSSVYTQTINALGIDNCSVYTSKLLNMTLYDELTQALIPSGVSANGSIEVNVNLYPLNQYPNGNYLIASYSKKFNNTNNGTLCIQSLGSGQYYMDAQIKYSATNYVTKLYNIQKYLLSTSTLNQTINLYNLPTTSNTNFLITLKDASFLPLDNALINIQRYYTGNGYYKSVEIPLSDFSGTSVGHFDLSGGVYTISLIKNNITLATFNNINVVCINPTISDCQLSLNVPSASRGFPDFTILNNIAYNISFNPNTKNITVQFATQDGSAVNMNLTAVSGDLTPVALCSNTLLSSAGIFNCQIPSSFSNGTILTTLYKDGTYITEEYYSIITPPSSIFGGDALIYVVVFVSILAMIFITSPEGILISLIISFIFLGILNIWTNTTLFGKTSSITWLVVAIGIVLYKLVQRRREGM